MTLKFCQIKFIYVYSTQKNNAIPLGSNECAPRISANII